MQTETKPVSLDLVPINSDKMSTSVGPIQVSLVDQSVQTHFSNLSTPEALSASQSDISRDMSSGQHST